MSEVRTLFRFCPSCGKRFHIKIESKKLLDDRMETRVQKVRASSDIQIGNRFQPTFPTILDVDVPVTVDIEDFEYSYKCKHCGHVWTEMHTQEGRVK